MSDDMNDDFFGVEFGETAAGCRIRLNHSKGGDPDEWPEALRVREFPTGHCPVS